MPDSRREAAVFESSVRELIGVDDSGTFQGEGAEGANQEDRPESFAEIPDEGGAGEDEELESEAKKNAELDWNI